MKIRTDFVTNSSSSSFIVIGSDTNEEKIVGNVYVVGSLGETEFGWGPGREDDIYSRINFAYLQCFAKDYMNPRRDWIEMLEKVIKENSDVENLYYNIDGYIDHQSSAAEGENTEIFDSEDNLKNFIFNAGSYIVIDNDNH